MIEAVFGTDTDRAWAAGFFDGEGSISVTKSLGRTGTLRGKNIKASVGQVDPEALYRFREATGIGHVGGPYGNANRLPAKPIYQYNALGIERVELMYEALWPYLGTVKKEQAIAKITEYRAWRTAQEALLPAGNRRKPLGSPRKALSY